MKAILVFPLSQTCNKFCKLVNLYHHLSRVEQKLYICYLLTSYLLHQQVSKPLHYSEMMSQRQNLKISIKLSLMVPSQKVAPTSVITDVSSCTVYRYSIVPRVNMSTVTPHPYAPAKFYRLISTFSFTSWNKNYTETYKCTQVLTVQMVTSGYIHANTSAQTYFM